MTPQQLGALIKRTGVRKSQNRKGRFYAYNTEGYELQRGWPKNQYHLTYRGETTLARETEHQLQRLDERRTAGIAVIRAALIAKGITVEDNGGGLLITLEEELA